MTFGYHDHELLRPHFFYFDPITVEISRFNGSAKGQIELLILDHPAKLGSSSVYYLKADIRLHL